MKKTNKKGFTLIEMLIAVAIIAVLAAIIIPTVSFSTKKAKAATDAANLRAAKAVISIGLLDGSIAEDALEDDSDAKKAVLELCDIPLTSKYDDQEFDFDFTDTDDSYSEVEVTYGEHTISYYAALAEGKSEDEAEYYEENGKYPTEE